MRRTVRDRRYSGMVCTTCICKRGVRCVWVRLACISDEQRLMHEAALCADFGNGAYRLMRVTVGTRDCTTE